MSGQFDQVDTGAKMAVVKQAGGIEHCLAPTRTTNGEVRMAEILATRKPKKTQTLQYYVHYIECEDERASHLQHPSSIPYQSPTGPAKGGMPAGDNTQPCSTSSPPPFQT